MLEFIMGSLEEGVSNESYSRNYVILWENYVFQSH